MKHNLKVYLQDTKVASVVNIYWDSLDLHSKSELIKKTH